LNTCNVDFYDLISQKFNDPDFIPITAPLPNLHEDYNEAIVLQQTGKKKILFIILKFFPYLFIFSFFKGYTMSCDKAKDLIGKMKPKVLKLCDRYERSGLGGGQ